MGDGSFCFIFVLRGFSWIRSRSGSTFVIRSVDNTDRSVSSRSIVVNDPLLLPTSLKRENVPPAVER